ncbi:MAG TPA: hypothetical protein VGK18_02255 [Propionicimonas sp.]|uniref:hypothetical protein n=1 Tax=Propionicimonas sp. TaxID=1955623 RepID=UPI002F414493
MRQRLIVASKPLHGLGNRVRLVLSGRSLADSTGREFAYYWPVGSGFGARLTDLWDFQASISGITDLALRVVAPYRDPRALVDDPRAGRLPIWHIRSANALPLPQGVASWHESLAALSLSPALAESVRALHDREFGVEPYVGVMVRTHRNSHDQTKQHSPLSWYVTRMHELQEELGDIRFYLSCDTAEADARLRGEFPTATSLAKTGSYNSRTAIEESVIDLYLLASSCHILGPHYSSFPELAHFLTLGQVPLETSVGDSYAQVRPPVTLSIAGDPVVPRLRTPAGPAGTSTA